MNSKIINYEITISNLKLKSLLTKRIKTGMKTAKAAKNSKQNWKNGIGNRSLSKAQ